MYFDRKKKKKAVRESPLKTEKMTDIKNKM